VLPKAQPDIEILVRHVVQQAIAQIPIYQTIQALPGFEQLAVEISKQITHQAIETLSGTLANAVTDEVTPALVQQLGQHFLGNLQLELNQKQTLTEIETLLAAWIEDLKLTVLQSFEAQNQQQIIKEAETSRWLRGNSPVEVLPQQRLS
jgi:LytS/YehU family sensor histidine kinase